MASSEDYELHKSKVPYFVNRFYSPPEILQEALDGRYTCSKIMKAIETRRQIRYLTISFFITCLSYCENLVTVVLFDVYGWIPKNFKLNRDTLARAYLWILKEHPALRVRLNLFSL